MPPSRGPFFLPTGDGAKFVTVTREGEAEAGLTVVMPVDDDSTLVKVQGWYDNEWGYANRLVDLVVLLGSAGPPPS